MGIGVSVFLLAVGAILGFAVDDTVRGVDVSMIGFILMGAGVIGLFMATLIFGRRDSAVVTEDRVVRDRTVI